MAFIKKSISLILICLMLFALVVPVHSLEFDAEEVYNSVFVVYSRSSMGSGFAVAENCIITNAHVIDDVRDVSIECHSGNEYTAEVVGIDYDLDIAVLLIRGTKFPYLSLADETLCTIGDDIYTIGAPMSMSYTLTKGIVSAKNRVISGQTYIQIDAPINSGNSGGPLLNTSGEVLGVNTMKLVDSEGIGLAIPASTVKDYIASLDLTITDNRIDEDTISSTAPITPEAKTDSNSDKGIYNKLSNKTIIAILAIIATLSASLNIIFIIILVIRRKPRIKADTDPRERTNFEIEFLE